MFTLIYGLISKIPRPWNFVAEGVLLVGILVIGFLLFGQIKACGYDKGRKEYEAESKQWATEKAQLQGQIAERDKQIEQNKAKEGALIAADQAGKKIDDSLAQKIDDVTKAAAAETVATDQPADCWVRADRTCAKLAGLKPPINIDCGLYKKRLCAR